MIARTESEACVVVTWSQQYQKNSPASFKLLGAGDDEPFISQQLHSRALKQRRGVVARFLDFPLRNIRRNLIRKLVVLSLETSSWLHALPT